MKPGIHPEYKPARITCACGRVTETYATVEELHVEICSHCHPFYTGRQKLVDTAGRVERFRRKYADSGDDADDAGDTGDTGGAAAEADLEVTGSGEKSDAESEDRTPEPVVAGDDAAGSDEADD